MKTFKKLTSVFVTVFMFVALCFNVNVHAADPFTITINNETPGHTYEAYQIFAGDLHEGKLSNITWGNGVTEAGKTALGDAAAKAELIKEETEAKAFAKEIAKFLTETPTATSTYGDKKYTITGLNPGYYLIKDKDKSVTGNDSYTEYILKVVKDVTTEPKSDVPSVEKKVDDENDSTDAENGEGWQDSADYDIGDNVPFKLTGTLPSNYAEYDYYTYIFHDTLSKGLTYNGDAKVYVVNKGEEDGVDITKYFTITAITDTETGKTALTISCKNLKVIKEIIDSNKNIVVKYTATLNGNANIGAAGNPNDVYLEYSNNPNSTGEGDNETGETPKDTVIVFTFQTIINKVDEKGNPLTGAEFTLEKKQEDGTWKTIDVIKNDEGTTFTFKGLDDGFYRLHESKTPEGYNSINDIYFVVEATHDVESADPELTSLVVKMADENGNVIEGNLGDGTFKPILGDGTISSDIVNKSGLELPETGGIGTTIFYVVGGGLMLVAAVLFITKKKMSK